MQLLCGDCLKLMKDIPDGSIDMILCDLPFGTTRNKWDSVLPLEELLDQYLRVLKLNGVICLHSDQPFTTKLITAFKKIWRYELVWVKEQGGIFLMPIENLLKRMKAYKFFIGSNQLIINK